MLSKKLCSINKQVLLSSLIPSKPMLLFYHLEHAEWKTTLNFRVDNKKLFSNCRMCFYGLCRRHLGFTSDKEVIFSQGSVFGNISFQVQGFEEETSKSSIQSRYFCRVYCTTGIVQGPVSHNYICVYICITHPTVPPSRCSQHQM